MMIETNLCMMEIPEFLYIFDGETFDFKDLNGDIHRVSISGIDALSALEDAFLTEKDGSNSFPLLVEQLSERNPELLQKASFVYELSILDEDLGNFVPAGLAVISMDWYAKNTLHINELAFRPQYQHLGLGTLLMRKIEEDAYLLDKDAITLQCYEDELEASEIFSNRFNFYKNLGYETLDRLPIKNLMYLPLVYQEDIKWKA